MREWLDRAACKDADHDLFFRSSTKEARAICEGCPVKEECLAYALEENIEFGVWGGKSPYQRLKIRKGEQLHDPDCDNCSRGLSTGRSHQSALRCGVVQEDGAEQS